MKGGVSRRALGALVLASAARAESGWVPQRPITVVVPFPPGGATDVTTRLLNERMAPRIPGTMVIDNRPGAATIIGAEIVARAAPDGHTLLMSSGTTLTINPIIGRNLPYKPEDLAPIALIATLPFALVVRQGLPDTVAAFVAHARANPGTINYGHNGRGSFNHIAAEVIQEQLGIRMQDIPYRGDAAQLNDLLAGNLDAMVVAGASALPAMRSGRARIVAWTSEARMPSTPEIPVFAETHPRLVSVTWFGLLAPARTPAAAIAKLGEAARGALGEEGLKAGLLAAGIVAARPDTPEAFAQFLAAERAQMEPLLRRLDIRLD